MVFRRRMMALRPIISTKNVVESSGILAASTNTVIDQLAEAEDAPTLAAVESVARGAKINGIYLSAFFTSEGGEVANEVPLLDWYLYKNQGGNSTTFSATGFPTPGSTGSHDNKRFIIHTEKGLTGGGDASLSGVPMVFKGVIALPRGYRKFNANDRLEIVARANFACKFCVQAIYRWYH